MIAELSSVLGKGELDRSLLHVFVAGPGTGEGVLVALPDTKGWIAVDGCKVGAEGCLDSLLLEMKGEDEPLALLVLTHPHEDHAAGIPELLERYQPTEVLVTADSPVGKNLVEQAGGWLTAQKHAATDAGLTLKHATAALVAIASWADANPGRLVAGADGTTRNYGRVELAVRASQAGPHLSSVLGEIAEGNRARANEASVVLELVFGKTRVVLGGDMPCKRPDGTKVPTGWDAVLGVYP